MEMFAERGPAFKSFVHRCNVEDSQLWFQFPKAPLIISIVGPRVVRAGDAKGHEASTTVSPGTEARLNSAGRPPKRLRSSDEHPAFQSNYTPNDKHVSHHAAHMGYGGIVNNSIRDASKMNGPTGPRQQMLNVARTGPGTTGPSWHTVPPSTGYGAEFWKMHQEHQSHMARQQMPNVAWAGPGTTGPSRHTVPPFIGYDAEFWKMHQEQQAHMARQQMPKVARTGPGTTDPSRYIGGPQSIGTWNAEFLEKMQSTGGKKKPKKPVPKADVPGPNGTL